MSTDDTPAIVVSTRDPVLITRSTVVGPDVLVRAGQGARVTIDQVTGSGGTGRFFYAHGIRSLVIRNSTIVRTTGIRLDSAEEAARIVVERNRARNIQPADYNTVFFQAADVQSASIEVAWNEVINAFGRSGVEDIVSIYRSANAWIHDNYLQGAYPRDAASGYSGSGIMIEGADAHHNVVSNNQVVETTNAGIGIAGGHHNTVRGNRLVFDGRLWDGTRLAAANVGVYVWNLGDHPEWLENNAYGNAVGWVGRQRRNDWWLPNCTGMCRNTRLTGALNRDRELAEFTLWKRKLNAKRIVVGRSLPNSG
jgi:parallel beta-helix repeat protein